MPSPSFTQAMGLVLQEETGGDPAGGYVDHPDDPGGETRWGISARAFPGVDIQHLTRADALELYRANYWDAVKGDQLPGFPVQLAVLDYAVNSGVVAASKALQRVIVSTPDGVVGPRTVQAVQTAVARRGSEAVALEVNLRRARHLVRLVRRRPESLAFLGGWWARTLRITAACKT